MSKKIHLTIPKPCHEDWENMTPVQQGKFCGSCQKQVVDFSNMSDRQVAEFFKKPSTGSVCGRFMTDQLDRNIEIPKKRIPWVKYFFQFVIPAFLVSIKASSQKNQGNIKVNSVSKDTLTRPVQEELATMGMLGQPVVKLVKEPIVMMKGDIKVVEDTIIKNPGCSGEIMGKIAMPVQTNKNEIEGIVVDEKGEPVPFASIETGKPGQGVMADENGIFRISKRWLSSERGFIVSSTGFESRKVVKGEESYLSGKLYVQLKTNVVLPEVVLTTLGTISCRRTMGEISFVQGNTSALTARKDSIINKGTKLPVEENRLIIYPNPVQSGSQLNLSFKNPDEGYYQLEIINQSGQTVQQNEIWIDAEAKLLDIHIPLVAAGSYFLSLTNKKSGKRFTEKIIIQ